MEGKIIQTQTIQPEIRLMQKKDVASILKIEQESFKLPWTEQEFQDFIVRNGRGQHGYVAEFNGNVIGYSIIMEYPAHIDILNISVSPTLRKIGIGSKLLQYIKDRLLTPYILENAYSHVATYNHAAKKLFEKHGFKAVTTIKNYFYKHEDAIKLKYEIPEPEWKEGMPNT